jgi:hypothetical protein
MDIPPYEGAIQGGPEPTSSPALRIVIIPRWPIGLEDPSSARRASIRFRVAHVVMGEECQSRLVPPNPATRHTARWRPPWRR